MHNPDENCGCVSRRDLIKKAAVAGTVAWATPMIVGSLASPAGALTPGPCTKYAVKIGPGPSVTCEPFCFENGSGYTFPANDAYWAGSCSRPTGCSPSTNTTMARTVGMTAKMPIGISTEYFFNASLGGNVAYRKVTLASGCYFTSATSWQIGGRYEPGDPGTIWKEASSSCASGPIGGNVQGCYTEGGSTAWILAFADGLVDTTPEDDINYVYLKFCCSS
ncbi:MAG: hypothetical protein WDA60_15925 [Acidimicrobiia bacterium]|jgi:hypothetical protein